MNKVFIISLPFIFSACTSITTLLPEATNIKIALEEPKECKFLGEVEGYKVNEWENLSLKEMIESAKNDLKNNAYNIGANTVLMLNQANTSGASGGMVGNVFVSDSFTKEYHIDGRAYLCP